MKKTSVYVFDFAVEGRGNFPLDMLRYDSAVPLTAEDALAISGDALDSVSAATRRVNLRRFGPVSKGPTGGRWASFGWSVVSVDSPESLGDNRPPADPLPAALPWGKPPTLVGSETSLDELCDVVDGLLGVDLEENPDGRAMISRTGLVLRREDAARILDLAKKGKAAEDSVSEATS